MKPRVLLITGPTASGKSALSLGLAERVGGEIVSADSMQVYRGFDVGTAKPTPEERGRVRHHLIDVVEPDGIFNAALFREQATAAIGEIGGRGRPALLVGGSALYIKVLLEGLAESPPRDEAVRSELNARWDGGEQAILWEELVRLDPHSAARLHPNDRTRVVRALEVVTLTGRSAALLRAGHGFSERPFNELRFGVYLERGELYRRIDLRVDEMMRGGWLEEVASLLGRYPPGIEPLKAIGYRELARHLTMGTPLAEEVEKIKRATRNFAKRQLTWMRGMGLQWVGPGELSRVAATAEDFFRSRKAGLC